MNLPQRSLAGGELAPSLHSRTDFQKFSTAFRTQRNFLTMQDGGVQVRPGFKYVTEVRDSTRAVRLIPFSFGDDATYIMEFGHQYIRFIKAQDNYLVLNAEDPRLCTSMTEADPVVFTSAAHGYSNNQMVIPTLVGTSVTNPNPFGFSESAGATVLHNQRAFQIANVTTDTFTLVYLNGPNAGNPVNGAGLDLSDESISFMRIQTLTSPYSEDDLFDLQFTQSGDTVTICHPDFAVRELTRTLSFGRPVFAITTLSLAPEIGTPQNLSSSGSGQNGVFNVTAISDETSEESLPSASHTVTDDGSLNWDDVTGAREYNVYKRKNGIFGLVYVTGTSAWTIESIEPDLEETPPIDRDPFDGAGNRPSTVTYIQQRLAFASSTNKPETCWLSRAGLFKNFTIRSPIRDDDAITFTIAGRDLNRIKHILDLGRFVLLTSTGEWVAEGGVDGVLTPTTINLKQQSYHGASNVRPVVVGKNAIYVQARSSLVRSLGFSFDVDGFTGSNLSVYASHLFKGYSLLEMAYHETPHSILWAVRNDGTLLGLTYVPEHEILAWHRHDTDGEIKSVCSIKFDTTDAIYVVVEREVDGRTVKYIEQLSNTEFDNVTDYVGMDSELPAFNPLGEDAFENLTNNGAITLSSSGGWDYEDTITLTYPNNMLNDDSPYTTSYVPGREIHVVADDGEIIRIRDIEIQTNTTATGKPHKTVPESMRGVELKWVMAVKTIKGLWHLEGKTVSVLADGFVVGSPNNPTYAEYTVTNGEIELDRHYAKVHIGIPYISDLETLDIDTVQGQSIADRKKLITKAIMRVESARGIWVGNTFPTPWIWTAQESGFFVASEFPDADPTEGMTELKIRDQEGYDDPVSLITDNIEVTFDSSWRYNGRMCIRQVDPLPLKILSIIPSGIISTGGR